MNSLKSDEIRHVVREQYGRVAISNDSGNAWCGAAGASVEALSETIGYSTLEMAVTPAGANMGLGSGNPHSIAHLKSGETVLDLGSGGGVDCFLASSKVGVSGQVIGVDMTPEMIEKAKALAVKANYTNVKFLLGEIENLPLADNHVDVAISNCVFNLSTDKPRAFAEAYRVLKPGGRIAFSDIVALAQLPEQLRQGMAQHVGCMAGAAQISDIKTMLHTAGFERIQIEPRLESIAFIRKLAPGTGIENYVVSANIAAVKPLN